MEWMNGVTLLIVALGMFTAYMFGKAMGSMEATDDVNALLDELDDLEDQYFDVLERYDALYVKYVGPNPDAS